MMHTAEQHKEAIERNGVCLACATATAIAEVEHRDAPLPVNIPGTDGPEQGSLDGLPGAGRQLSLVWDIVRDGSWHTLSEVAARLNMPEQSVSARLRDLRKPEHGGWTVRRMRQDDGKFAYRVTQPHRELARQAS